MICAGVSGGHGSTPVQFIRVPVPSLGKLSVGQPLLAISARLMAQGVDVIGLLRVWALFTAGGLLTRAGCHGSRIILETPIRIIKGIRSASDLKQ